MDTRILIVEDDIELAALTQKYLSSRGFDVYLEHDGGEAPNAIFSLMPAITILDLMLPNLDGISICKAVRPQYQGLIMMLTASNDDFDQVVALEVGIDDFVHKPIEPRVLLARLNALLRRAQPLQHKLSHAPSQHAKFMHFKELTINESARSLKLKGQEINLTTQEFELLHFLATHAGDIIDREVLFKALKNYDYDGQNRYIDIMISQIRKKLGNEADNYVKTIRGKGYLFVID